VFERMMVAIDGSERSRRALKAGIGLASRLNNKLHTITVIEGSPDYVVAGAYTPIDPALVGEMVVERESQHQGLVNEARLLAFNAGVAIQTEIVVGTAVESIVQAVKQHGCDLLIIGLNQHPGLIAALTSHTGYDVTERAPCSVLGIR